MEPHVNYDMVNSSKYKKKLEQISKESIKSERPIKYNTKTKKKPKNYMAILKKIVILTGIGVGVTFAGKGVINAIDTTKNYAEITKEFESDVLNAKHSSIYKINPNTNTPYVYYNESELADTILYKHQEFDIDSRIYGVYSSLDTSNRSEVMDDIFRHLHNNVNAPGFEEKFDETVKRACKHPSFQKYLEAHQINEKQYIDKMERLKTEYAKRNMNADKLKVLIEDFNLTSGGKSWKM